MSSFRQSKDRGEDAAATVPRPGLAGFAELTCPRLACLARGRSVAFAAYTEELVEGLTAHGEKSSGVAQSRERPGNVSPGQGDAEYGEVAGLSPAPGRTFSAASTDEEWWRERDLFLGFGIEEVRAGDE